MHSLFDQRSSSAQNSKRSRSAREIAARLSRGGALRLPRKECPSSCGMEIAAAKIPSRAGELTLTLEPLPKLLTELRIALSGEPGSSAGNTNSIGTRDEVLAAATRQIARDRNEDVCDSMARPSVRDLASASKTRNSCLARTRRASANISCSGRNRWFRRTILPIRIEAEPARMLRALPLPPPIGDHYEEEDEGIIRVRRGTARLVPRVCGRCLRWRRSDRRSRA